MTALDVPGPLNMTIPPINYTFQSYTGVCKFFNKTAKKWSISGLEVKISIFSFESHILVDIATSIIVLIFLCKRTLVYFYLYGRQESFTDPVDDFSV